MSLYIKIAMKISFNTPNQDTKVFDGGFYYLVFKGGLEFFIQKLEVPFLAPITMLLECLCAREPPYLVLSEWDHARFGFHLYVVLSPACNYWRRGGAASVPCLVLPSPQFPYICSEVIVSASFFQLYHFGLHPTTHWTKTLSEESSKDKKLPKIAFQFWYPLPPVI